MAKVSRLRHLAKAVLPRPAVEQIRYITRERSLRPLMEQQLADIDLAPLELLRGAPRERLRDADFLEHELLPKLGLNDELLHQFPPSLFPYTGKGLRHWQYPNQFSKYLVEISKLGVQSYLEIGTRHGGTFVLTVEYLSRFTPVGRAVGIDLSVPSPALRRWANDRPGVTILQGDSQGRSFRRLVRESDPFDLVLIDGDHSEEGCRADYALVADRSQALVFHDIVSEPTPGVRVVWDDLKETRRDSFVIYEFTDQYEELKRSTGADFIGIGLAIPRSWRDRST